MLPRSAILPLAAFILGGCAHAPPPKAAWRPEAEPIHVSIRNHIVPPIQGTFTVAWFARDFSESPGVRAERDEDIKNRVIDALGRSGLTYVDPSQKPDYDVTYSYYTQANTAISHGRAGSEKEPPPRKNATYTQHFSITITKTSESGPPSPAWAIARIQWDGDAEVASTRDPEITDFFRPFIDALLDPFPNKR